ncbi:hypothetical protein SASPL_109387 [Salvia splendens]|uniref:F-box domain-containing protein n=1 Tax=Salvia splendens TaxID=180675 RepID=A0A8X9A7I0_SALSN|nr:hypothetical protein SASPL_109387 [Salvia splendens]
MVCKFIEMEEKYVVDRISELPDSLILEILSLTQLKDAVATSLLSKRWKNLWTTITIPCLDLSQQHSNSLAQWKGPNILRFNLHVYFWSDDGSDDSLSWMRQFNQKPLRTSDASDVDSWLLFAIEKQVEELYIFTSLLTRFCVEFLLEMKKKDMAVPSSNAKFLLLNDVKDAKDMLHLVEMMFPKVETLFLHVGYKSDESGEESNFRNPPLLHLKRVEINRSICDVSIIPVIRVLLRNGGVFEKMVIRFIQSCKDGGKPLKPEMFSLAEEKVMNMPKSSPTAQVIIRQV